MQYLNDASVFQRAPDQIALANLCWASITASADLTTVICSVARGESSSERYQPASWTESPMGAAGFMRPPAD